MCGRSLRRIGQGVLETKRLHTDRQTDRQTDRHVQTNMSSLLRKQSCHNLLCNSTKCVSVHTDECLNMFYNDIG